jgi:multidrug efflux pump subunit AcrA (membrane-fusion protein)
MRALTLTTIRTAAIRVVLLGPALVLSACQVVAPTPAPVPRIPANQTTANVVPTPSTATTQSSTVTIKRDTLSQSLALSGTVVPGRSAQLTFRGSGTVTAVNVTSGQTVHEGDVLAEFALDDNSLQAARAQATLADIAYQTEQAKLDDLQAGANKDAIQQLRVTIEKDQADIQKLEQEKATIQATNGHSDQALVTAQAIADRKAGLADVALQAAQDSLDAAQGNVKKAQDEVKANQQRAAAAQEQTSADAATAAASAAAAVRAGQRQLDGANLRLAQAKEEPNATRANQGLETQQLKVDQDKDALNDARQAVETASGQSSSTDHTARQIAAEVAAATASVHAGQRVLAMDSLELKHQQTNLTAAQSADAAEIKTAGVGVDVAKEQLANLQIAEQAAQEKAQRVARAAGIPPVPSQLSVEAAQAAVKQAQANVQTATINRDDAQAAQAAAADAKTDPAQFADHALTASQAQLSADQARMQTLQGGAPALELTREQTKVDLLRGQSTAATAAAQPTVELKAPFDANVADVGITPGENLAPGATASSDTTTAGRTPAIRLVAAGTTSIVANASESDVAQLDRGQSLDLSFPGLPGQAASGTIVDIASTPTVNKDNQVTYPVRLDVASPPTALKLGMTAQATLSVAEAKDVLVAPRRAVRTVGGQTLVDKLGSDGQVQAVPVQVGRSYGLNVELLGGVQEGDVVAIYDPITASAKQP